MKINGLFLAGASFAAILGSAPAAVAQTQPALMDLPSFVVYIAQHPTRPFTASTTQPANIVVNAGVLSSQLQGGSLLNITADKQQHHLDTQTSIDDPRKARYASSENSYSYGREFAAVGDINEDGFNLAVYQSKAGTAAVDTDLQNQVVSYTLPMGYGDVIDLNDLDSAMPELYALAPNDGHVRYGNLYIGASHEVNRYGTDTRTTRIAYGREFEAESNFQDNGPVLSHVKQAKLGRASSAMNLNDLYFGVRPAPNTAVSVDIFPFGYDTAAVYIDTPIIPFIATVPELPIVDRGLINDPAGALP